MSDRLGELGWWCRWCGYSPGNRAAWCDLGCGSDYNEMRLLPVPAERSSDAASTASDSDA